MGPRHHPHRKLLKEGFLDEDGKRISVEDAFKKETHPFRVAIVCAMWLTGFDVPSLATLYLDKPLKAHTLMQAIARANRVNEGKNNGLIVDYCGILKSLRQALWRRLREAPEARATAKSIRFDRKKSLLEDLAAAIGAGEGLPDREGRRSEPRLSQGSGFSVLRRLRRQKNPINENDETRKRFEVMAREVFNKFKACLTM